MRRALLLVTLAAACSSPTHPTHDSPDAGHSTPPATAPAFDRAFRISTHNSYWVDRGVTGDLFASGTQERLLDQLLLDHARGIEIDIHEDPAKPSAFSVYHTAPGNVLCDTLGGCLAIVRAFHHALPKHEALHVTLELKELMAPNFDATHTIEDLDAALEDELGDLLYRPRELLARCPGEAKLGACVKKAGWPETHALRGRVVVSILGNWNGLPGAQATRDWIDYALHGKVEGRAAFPMASSWQLDREALSGAIYGLVTQDELDRAYAESVFLQIEDLADPNTAGLLARHGVVRVDNAFSIDDQKTRVEAGLQLLQTDSPWVQYDDRGPSQPLRSLDSRFGAEAMTEPGSRLALGPGKAGERVFAYRLAETTSTTTWETTVSSGADATRVGCLRAAAALPAGADSVTICRTKISAVRDPGDAGPTGNPDAERVIVVVETCSAGACTTAEFSSKEPAPGGPGDLLRVEVSSAASGSSCVKVSSAATASRALEPDWEPLGAPLCVSAPLVYQGRATGAPAEGGTTAGFFFGTRLGGSEVRAADLTGAALGPAGATREDAGLLSAE